MSNGCGENYAVIIVSEQFEGKMTLARHRLGKFLALLVSRGGHGPFGLMFLVPRGKGTC